MDAEREIIRVVVANIARQEDEIVAEFEISKIDPEDLLIQATSQEALIAGAIPASADAPSIFAVVRFDESIDPGGVRANYDRGVRGLLPRSRMFALSRRAPSLQH